MDAFDKPHKPYVPIDTCSPGGTWVEERRYNRCRPTARDPRKVLCGNWQEERALENDLLDLESTSPSAGGRRTGSALGASLEVIQDKGNGHYAGGFSSAPYLTRDAAHPNLRLLETTHRADFTAAHGDVRSLRRPRLGVRSQILLAHALEAAKEEQSRQETERRRQGADAVPRSLEGIGGTATLETGGPYASVYMSTIGKRDGELPVVEALQQDYLHEEPITLYTGNPRTSAKMIVTGKTPIDPHGHTQFGRHTHFSEVKYAL